MALRSAFATAPEDLRVPLEVVGMLYRAEAEAEAEEQPPSQLSIRRWLKVRPNGLAALVFELDLTDTACLPFSLWPQGAAGSEPGARHRGRKHCNRAQTQPPLSSERRPRQP
jgi:hypothetical protein